jgi:hypothetical protein
MEMHDEAARKLPQRLSKSFRRLRHDKSGCAERVGRGMPKGRLPRAQASIRLAAIVVTLGVTGGRTDKAEQ